jgi:colanic acid/amylovoran biosynthesis protein
MPRLAQLGLIHMEQKPTNVCILGATFDTGNMGVSMLAAGAIQFVARSFPQARITLLDYARTGYEFDFPYEGREIRVQLLNIRFSKRFYLANNLAMLILLVLVYRLAPFERFRRQLLLRNKYLKTILESDLAVSIAYGDSFSDIYGMARLLYVALPQLLVLLGRKRLILLPQTIGPFRRGIAKAIAKHILKRAETIYSRDYFGLKTSRALLGKADKNNKLRFCYDLAFDVDAVRPVNLDIVGLPAMRNGQPLVGINISGLLLSGGYTQDNMFGLKVRYDTLVQKLIEFFINQKSANVLLIPHVFASADDLESDSGACETVFDSLRTRYEGRIGLARGSYDYDEIKYVIGQCDFFVGARMHACIGAISQNVPTVPIAYSDKFAGVMQAIGFEDLVVDPRRMDEQEILQVVDRVYERRSMVRREFEFKIPLVKETIRTALCDVEGVIRRTPGKQDTSAQQLAVPNPG